MDQAKHASIVEAIGQLDPETGFTRSGLPEVSALEALLEFPVSADERNAAWESFQNVQKEEAPEPDSKEPEEPGLVTCADLLPGLRKKGFRI